MTHRLPGVPGTDVLPADEKERLPPGMSAKRKALVDCMIFEGLDRRTAAVKVGLSDRGSRYALNAPQVMAYYKRQLQVLRESEKPKSIARMATLRDGAKSEKISFEAAKTLAAEPSGGPVINLGIGVSVRAGYVLDVTKHRDAALRILRGGGGGSTVFDRDRRATAAFEDGDDEPDISVDEELADG